MRRTTGSSTEWKIDGTRAFDGRHYPPPFPCLPLPAFRSLPSDACLPPPAFRLAPCGPATPPRTNDAPPRAKDMIYGLITAHLLRTWQCVTLTYADVFLLELSQLDALLEVAVSLREVVS